MDFDKAIQVLEALASGCSPTTGEVIEDSVINERDVIRALQISLDLLRSQGGKDSTIEITEEEIRTAMNLFSEHGQNPTSSKLMSFFLGTRKFKNDIILSSELYGKYGSRYAKGQLLDHFDRFFNTSEIPKKVEPAYRQIDFFETAPFNKLSDKAVDQLKEKVKLLGITKTENLPESVKVARIEFPRAYEPWGEEEKILLSKAIKYTNNLKLLSECFQRGVGSIRSSGQKILYEESKKAN